MAVPIPQPIAPVATDHPNAQPNMQPPPPPEGATEFSIAPPPPPEGATEFKQPAQPKQPTTEAEWQQAEDYKKKAWSDIINHVHSGDLHSAAGSFMSLFQNPHAAANPEEMLKGAGKSVGQDVNLVSQGLSKIMPSVVRPTDVKALDKMETQSTPGQEFGGNLETLAEFMLGEGAIEKGVSRVAKLKALMPTMKMLEESPRLMKAARGMYNISKLSGASAGVGFVHPGEGQTRTEGAVSGAEAGAVLGGIGEGAGAGVDAVRGVANKMGEALRPTTTEVGSTSVPVRNKGAIATTLQKGVPEKMQEFYSQQTSPAVAKGIGDLAKDAGSTLGETTTKESDPMGMLSHADEKAGRAQEQFQKVDKWSKNKLSEYQTQADNARGDFTTEGRAKFNEAMDAQDSLFDVYKKKFPDEAADIDSAKKDWREQVSMRRVNKALARTTTSANGEGVDYKFKQGKQLANSIHSLISDDRDLLGRAGFTDEHIENLKQFGKIIEEEGNIPKVDRITRILSQIALKSVGVGGGFAAGGPFGVGVGVASEMALEKSGKFLANRVLGKILTTPEALTEVTEAVKGGATPTLLEKMTNSDWFNKVKEGVKNLHQDESGEMTIPGSHSGGADGFLRGRHMDWDSQNTKSVVPDQPEDGVIEDDKEDEGGVANNASGESPVSQEALNRQASEKSQGVKRVVVDTRSGAERPLIGADAVDYQAKPYESVEFRGGDRDGEVIDQGRGARPYTRKTAAPNAAFSKGANDTDLFRQAKEKLGPDASLSEIAQEAQRMKDGATAPSLLDHANEYNKSQGRGPIDAKKIGPELRMEHLADAYDEMEHNPDDFKTRSSYEALKKDILSQYKYATEKMGMKIDVQDEDPYGEDGTGRSPEKQLFDDVHKNKHVSVYGGGNPLLPGHPLAAVSKETGLSYNSMLRAVHDLFGHVVHNNEFSEVGEENAWNAHRQMMSPEAVPALTTETKGQTNWYYHNSNARAGNGGTFAEQKAGLLPEQFHSNWDENKVLDHIQSGKDFAILQAENPKNTRISDGENAKRTAKLLQDLHERGHEAVPVGGNTKDVEGQTEHAFFVPDISPADAAELGRKHQQAAILTNEGLHDLANDTVAPADNKNLKFDNDARQQQYFTTVGKKDFSVPLDFDNMHSAAKNGILSPGGLSDEGRAALQKAHSSPYAPVESFADVAKFLPDSDLAKISERAQKTIVKHLQELGDPSMIEEAAKAGSIQRGWYKRTGDLIRGTFGNDAKKFTDILAVTSPNTSVEINFRNALNFFADWVGAGKPTGPEGAAALDKVLAQHNFGIANSAIKDNIRGLLLEGKDPSGPKVSNFSKNIQGEMDAVTKDRWVAYLLGKGTKYFNTGMKGEGPRAGHYATDIIFRQVAKKLDMLPAEVQESGWSFIRTALNMAEEKGITPDEAARTVTNDDIKRGSSEFTRLIATDTGIRIALDKLADRTGNDAFRPVNIEKSGLYQHLRQAADQQQPVAGGIASANPEILARTAERASAARAGAGAAPSTAGPVDDTSFNPSELDKPENPNVAAQETDAAAVDPIESARRASIRRAKQQEKLAKRGVSGGSDADVPPFYSKAAQVINQKIANMATPEQIRATLKNNGVKDSELQWMGLDSFLKEKTKVSKADLEKFVQQNQIQLKDVTHGSVMTAEIQKLNKARAEAYALNNKVYHDELVPLGNRHNVALRSIIDPQTDTPEQIEAVVKTVPEEMQDATRRFLESDADVQEIDRQTNALMDKQGDVISPKYTSWQLGGISENPREVLMQIKPQQEAAVQSIDDMAQREYGRPFYKLTKAEAQHVWTKMTSSSSTDPNVMFEHNHWDEPNIVAHVRMNDRTSLDGKKLLFMEEAQSDWAQRGNAVGWKSESETTPAQPAGTKFELEQNPDGRGYTIHDEHGRTWWAGTTSLEDAQERLAEYNRTGIPAQPAKTRTGNINDMPYKNTWHELTMKKMLRLAAENGYDQLAWTTGAQQAARYSLEKQIDALHYAQDGGGYHVDAVKNGHIVHSFDGTAEKIAEYVGKDIAKKIAEGQGTPLRNASDIKKLSGVDLKVGGEFHRKLYDQKIPQFLEKYAKKWGAKVGTTEVSTATTPYPFVLKDIDGVSVGVYKTEKQATDALEQSGQAHRGWHIEKDDKTEKVHSIQITPEMKKSVMKEGQPIAKAEPTWADGLKDLAV